MYTTVKQFNQYVLTLVEDVKAFNLTPTLFNSYLFGSKTVKCGQFCSVSFNKGW